MGTTRGIVRLTIGLPIVPQGLDWAEALQVRATARAYILRHCREPDLAPVLAADLAHPEG
jgi:hypothetical protein